jgi:hypothetical protein
LRSGDGAWNERGSCSKRKVGRTLALLFCRGYISKQEDKDGDEEIEEPASEMPSSNAFEPAGHDATQVAGELKVASLDGAGGLEAHLPEMELEADQALKLCLSLLSALQGQDSDDEGESTSKVNTSSTDANTTAHQTARSKVETIVHVSGKG